MRDRIELALNIIILALIMAAATIAFIAAGHLKTPHPVNPSPGVTASRTGH